MTISLKQFIKSRWAPWTLAVILLAILSGGGWYGTGLQRKVTTLQQEKESLTFEVAQAEYALRQEKQKQTATKKTTEEKRPDGTTIVTREETDESSSSRTEETGKSQSERTVTEREKSIMEETISGPEYSVGVQGILPLNQFPPTDYGLGINAGRKLFGPIWLKGGLELDGTTYSPERFSLGLEWQF